MAGNSRLRRRASERVEKRRRRFRDYTGYAFGMGVERLAMLRYDVRDLRTLL